MNCPICWKEMTYRSDKDFVPFYHHEDEETYYRLEITEIHTCFSCKVQNIDGKWLLPEKDQPTIKQSTCIGFICRNLDCSFPGVTKYDASLFIEQHLEESMQALEDEEEALFDLYLESDLEFFDWG